MNKRKILYIVALILLLMFIFVVAFIQEPVNSDENNNKQSKEYMDEKDDNTEAQQIITIHQEELQEDIVTDYEQLYQEYQVPSNRGFKSYMSYKAVTSKSSSQYKLQSQYAYTGEYGIRQVDERFCVAIGMFSNARVGTYIDLILENGTIIPCIVGDFKANIHTDSSNIVTNHNGCISEFLVDNNVLYSLAKQMGDISYCKEEWKSPVKTIKVYEKNIFDGE